MPFEILVIFATCTCKVISVKRRRTIGVGDGGSRKVSDAEFGNLWGNCGPSLKVEGEGSRCPRFICHSQKPTSDCTIRIKVSQPGALRALPLYASSRNGNYACNSSSNKRGSMASMKYVLILIVMLGIAYEALGASEDSYRNLLGLNYPYGRGLNNELQVARLLLLPPCLCHTKRNSELINSLLGLPKNMNNAGK